MTLILAPYLASPWVPMSPDVADLSTRLDRLDGNLRDLGHGAKALADAWGESFGEMPAAVELSSPAAAGDSAKRLADRWEKENA